jgi:hypothetical protein
MSPDVSAQIIAKAWSDEHFAQSLQGPDPYVAIYDTLGVSVPAGTPLPQIPPAPAGATAEALGVQRTVQGVWLSIVSLLSTSLLCGDSEPEPDDPLDQGACA